MGRAVGIRCSVMKTLRDSNLVGGRESEWNIYDFILYVLATSRNSRWQPLETPVTCARTCRRFCLVVISYPWGCTWRGVTDELPVKLGTRSSETGRVAMPTLRTSSVARQEESYADDAVWINTETN